MLGTPRSTLIGVSSTAPLYSLAVTVGLITPLVGQAAPVALLVAAVPMLLVVRAMSILDARWRDQGTVYRWAREAFGRRTGLLGGWLLALSGILVMASLAQVASDSILDALGLRTPWSSALLGLALLIGLASISSRGIEQGMAVQVVTAIVQTGGIVVAVVALLMSGGQAPPPPSAGLGDWVHAVLLALFIYWGWDSTYALTEESHDGVAGRGASASMILLVGIYVVLAWAYSSAGASEFPSDPVVEVALFASALASCQNTVIPTSRGLVSMARRGDLPGRLAHLSTATWLTTAVAGIYLVVMVAAGQGFFDDSIESMSVFVAGYYLIACLAALLAARSLADRAASLAGALLMAFAGAVTASQFFDPAYGATSLFGVGTVGLFALGALVLFGVAVVVSDVRATRRHRTADLRTPTALP